jgi:hypothetical protein
MCLEQRLLELSRLEPNAWLVGGEVVAKLVSPSDEVADQLLAASHAAGDQEERGVRFVAL